jgi:cytochrome c peroxidase
MKRIKFFIIALFLLFSVSFFATKTTFVSSQGSLSAPTGVNATDNMYSTKVGIYWDTIRGATSYRIFRNTTNNSASATEIGITVANSFYDSTAAVGQTYYYWIKSDNGSSQSSFSNSDQGVRANGSIDGGVLSPLEPPTAPTQNPVTAAKIYLGKTLFWDEQLSSTRTVACGTCHGIGSGGTDLRSKLQTARSTNPGFDNTFGTADDIVGSIGVPKNNSDGYYNWSSIFGVKEQVTGRKANSFLNAGYSTQGIFWDGRASNEFRDPITNQVIIPFWGGLESQAAGPPVSDVEMAHGNRNWIQTASQIATSRPLALSPSIPTPLQTWINSRSYPQLFQEVYGSADVTPAKIAMAIATYERSLFTDQTPFDKALQHIETLTPQEENGRLLFDTLLCSACHGGQNMSDESFHNIGVRPQAEDKGRFNVTNNTDDLGRFRTPPLRNVELRAPFMHNGRFNALEDVVEFYNRGGDFTAINVDLSLIRPLNLSAQEKADLVAFLKRPLTDPRVTNQTPPFDSPTLYMNSSRVPTISGTGRAGSGSFVPKVTAIEPPVVGNPNFTIGVSEGLGNAQAVLVINNSDPGVGSAIPTSGSFAYQTVTLAGSGAGNGYGSTNIIIPNNPALVGQTFYGRWYVNDASATNGFAVSQLFTFTIFGTATAKTYFDYDADGKTDVSVFRPSNGAWYMQNSTTGFYAVAFGQNGDKVVPADFSGDGKTDVAVYRSGTWYVFDTSNNTFYGIPFGNATDIPAPADYDGDGKADLTVFRPSTGQWYIQQSANGFLAIPFGQNGDVPTVGDYDGDGKSDIAVFRPSNGVWYRFNSGSNNSFFAVQFGQNGDKVVPADYTGDGKTDIAIFRSGTWYILRSEDLSFYGIPFGLATDIPSPGDFDGDGKADQAVYRNGQWYIQQSTSGFLSIPFGLSTDTPTESAFVY